MAGFMAFRILQFTVVLPLLVGIVVLFSSSGEVLQAQLMGQGAIVLEQPALEWMAEEGGYHFAAFEEFQAFSSGRELTLGILLILLGFAIHTFVVLHQEKNEGLGRLLVSGKRQKKKRGFYRYAEWMWIEIR